jgi:hypothetical protein
MCTIAKGVGHRQEEETACFNVVSCVAVFGTYPLRRK